MGPTGPGLAGAKVGSMGLFDAVGAADVMSAIEEYDKLGGEEFRGRYGFGRAHEYVLWHDGRTYDSKAILGVARRFATGTPAAGEEFRGGIGGAATLLTDLGFHVTSIDVYADFGSPVTGSWRELADVGAETAYDAWATAAYDVLLQAAQRYRAVVGEEELAMQVMYRTGIRSDDPVAGWLGDVLGRVASACAVREEPLLPALCVDGDGRTPEGYAAAVALAHGPAPADPADHALRERLRCYRHFRAVGLPADGGSVSGTSSARRQPSGRPRAAARAKPTRPPRIPPAPSRRPTPPEVATCPTCFMALPVTGVCDSCG